MKIFFGITGLCVALISGTSVAALQSHTSLPLSMTDSTHWVLPAGEYLGQFSIDQPGTLFCEPGAIIDAEGDGNALIISVAGVRVEGCNIRHWGRDLTAMNAGIFIERQATGAVVNVRNLSNLPMNII